MDGVNNAFCMSKEEYELARLATKCAGLQGKIDDQAAEIASLQALWSIAHAERSEAMLELAKCRSICDQMGEFLNDAATSLETIAMRSYGDESCINTMQQVRCYANARASVARKDLEAWRAMK